MTTNGGAPRCDAAMKMKTGERACTNPATWGRKSVSGLIMRYCETHRDRAENPGPMHFRPAPGSKPFKLDGES